MRGALESVQDKPDLSNPSDALHVAEQLVDEGTTPSLIIEGGKLARTAPAVFQELAPLLKLDLLIAGCRPLRGRYRISKRSVSESGTGDEVSITIEPLSHPSKHGHGNHADCGGDRVVATWLEVHNRINVVRNAHGRGDCRLRLVPQPGRRQLHQLHHQPRPLRPPPQPRPTRLRLQRQLERRDPAYGTGHRGSPPSTSSSSGTNPPPTRPSCSHPWRIGWACRARTGR